MPEDAIHALDIPIRQTTSIYPAVFAARMGGRVKRQLGNHFGLTNFGVNLTELAPGAQSALLHRHTRQDEFVYILAGTPTLRTEAGDQLLAPGMCVGFPAAGIAHQLLNLSDAPVQYLEIGDRSPNDQGDYPADDLEAKLIDGAWRFFHKDGRAYED